MNRRLLLIPLALVLIISLVAIGCPAEETTPPTTPPTTSPTTTPTETQLPEEIIKVGLVSPLTGAAATWGLSMLHGIELALEDWNDAGGVVVDGVRYKFTLIAEDDKWQTDVGVDAVNKLVYTDGVKFINGPMHGQSSLSTAPLFAKEKVIQFATTYEGEIMDAGNTYTFRTLIPGSMKGASYFGWIVDTYGVKTAAHLTLNNTTGWNETEAAHEWLTALGVEITEEIYYEAETTDFMPFLSKIMTKEPDLLSLSGSPLGTVAIICKQARGLGYEGVINSLGPMGARELVDIVGAEAVEGLISTSIALEPPLVSDLMLGLPEREIEKYGEPYMSTWDFYFFGDLLCQAIERAGSIDTEDIKAILEDTSQVWEYKALTGEDAVFGCSTAQELYPAHFVNHQVCVPYVITVVENGKDTNAAVVRP